MDEQDDRDDENAEASPEIEDLGATIRFDFTGSCSSCGDSPMNTSVAIQIPTCPLSQPVVAAPPLTHCSLCPSPSPSLNEDESDIVPWLQALELHAIGACRTDERLRPVLRWNVSCFGADGRILGCLGLHFKAKELALLARCLCTPLVSIRVGRVSCHGHVLYPTSIRGHLSLTMLPSSALRLSFREDSGSLERLSQMAPSTTEPPVVLEHLPADLSSRSFVLKLPEHRLAFFWQSEKIKAVGDELILKMKDFLIRRPTLSELTGIPESRLETLASYINSSLLPSEPSPSSSSSLSGGPCLSTAVSTRTSESAIIPPTTPSPSGLLPSDSPLVLPGIVSPLPIAVSLGLPSVPVPTVTSTTTASTITTTTSDSNGIISDDGDHRNLFMEMDRDAFAQRLLGSLPRSIVPFPLLRVSGSTAGSIAPRIPASSASVLTPCYCPCPLGNVSALQCNFAPPFLPSLPSDHHLPSSTQPSPSLVADLYSSLPFPSLLPLPSLPSSTSLSSSSIVSIPFLPNLMLHSSDSLETTSEVLSSNTISHLVDRHSEASSQTGDLPVSQSGDMSNSNRSIDEDEQLP